MVVCLDNIKEISEINVKSLDLCEEDFIDDISEAIKYSKEIYNYLNDAPENFLVLNKKACEQIQKLACIAQDVRNHIYHKYNRDYNRLNHYTDCAKTFYETLVIFDFNNVAKFKSNLDEASINAEKIAEICKNADEQYNDVKGVLKNTLISNQANVFTNESKRYNKSAYIWLVCAGAAFVFDFILLLYFACNWKHDFNNSFDSYNFLVCKFALCALLMVICVACYKNYVFNMNNSISNRNKAARINVYNSYSSLLPETEQNTMFDYMCKNIFNEQHHGLSDKNEWIDVIKECISKLK